MKKLVILILILLMAPLSHLLAQATPGRLADPMQTSGNRLSLNGHTFDGADALVTTFQDNPGAYSQMTTFWFSKAYLKNLVSLLNSEGADGIRIYFARNPDGQNTIVLVSTQDDGPNPPPPGKRIHMDYFRHNANFLDTTVAETGDEAYLPKKDNGGALLYGNFKCPNGACNIYYNQEHYISCTDANSAVSNALTGDEIETTAEWFDLRLFTYILQQLDAAAHGDGIRIYYCERKDRRHVFIIVNTQSVQLDAATVIHKDDFNCYPVKDSTFINYLTSGNDNGEQCPDNCTGVTLPNP